LSRASGVCQIVIGQFLNLKRRAVHKKSGRWTKSLISLSETLRCMPEDLVPPQHVERPLAKNSAEAALSATEIDQLMFGPVRAALPPDVIVQEHELAALINDAMEAKLTAHERAVLRARFGFDGEKKTRAELAAELGVTAQRVAQIEGKALWKLG